MLSLILMFNLEIFGILLLFWVLKDNLFLDEEYSWMFKNSDVNFLMSLLVILLYLMVLMVNISYKFSLNLMFLALIYLMSVSNLMVFFYLYEMVFILIMFSIILLGYSYERLMASFLMMFYSFLFSSPALLIILMLDRSFLIKNWLQYSLLISYFLVGSFMVKFPIFGFHYWLPVAHVEASTIGSMILAALLLKLGSIGLLYVISYLGFMVKFHWLGIGVLVLMLMILSLSDLKMMIAYSSIAHMSMVFYVMMLGTMVGKKGAVYMMFYHGFISPLMFWVVGILAWWKTRSLMVIKLISFSYLFLLCLFVLLILNMGFPPFMGFLSEVLMLKSLISYPLMLGVMIWAVLLSCYYNVYLFWCFNGFMGMVFKLNFFSLDLFMFMGLAILVNV
uniref:NADH-ubiquinone oxidoreductase chain 4 n=1 Tax=Rotaria rotatoria TaxID=231624 RepID=D1KRS8_9BILA|nr:NADH dehydrogenase subunit 4 [Rotaria rotatoria]ACT21460.1 NADH dehydrogenase subunit 4 [Rotaria rotatoria]